MPYPPPRVRYPSRLALRLALGLPTLALAAALTYRLVTG